MGWLVLTGGLTYKDALNIADKYKLACVSLKTSRKYSYYDLPVRPIVSRTRVKYHWYNYFEDGTYRKTTCRKDNPELKHYAVYFYIPSKIRFLDFLDYTKEHLTDLRGKFRSFALYLTETGERVIYSVELGVIHCPVETYSNNPLLYFETGQSMDASIRELGVSYRRK